MNILKPQNLHFQKLENKCLIDLDEDEKINYCNFENEEYNNINLYDIEFEHCKFTNICMQKSKLEKLTFKDVSFDNVIFLIQNL